MTELRVDIKPVADRAAAAAVGRDVAAGVARGVAGGSAGFQAEMRRLTRQVRTAAGRAIIDPTTKRQFQDLARSAEETARRVRASTGSLASGFKAGADAAEEMLADIKAIEKVIAGQKARGNRLVDPREAAELNNVLRKLQNLQRRIRLVDPNDVQGIRKIRLEFEALNSEATKAKTQFRSSVDEAIAAARLRSNTEARASRESLEAFKTAQSQQRFVAQRTQQEILSNTQRSNAARLQASRFFFETVGRLERGLGATIGGVARTATNVLSRAYNDTLGRLSSAFSRSGRNITNIERSTASSRLSIFRSAQSQQERLLRESVTRQSVIIQRAQQQSNRGLVGASRRSSLLGLGGGLAGFGLITAGLERFSNIERLNKQFVALTGSVEQAAFLMGQVKQFAKETPFDLVGVADLAKGFLAIKTPVDQVLPRVRAIADAVALTGGGVDELNRIQRAIGQIASAGKLQGDEINQLAENLPGLNIRQIAADLFGGGSFARFQELNDAGEISGEEFIDGFITTLANDPRLVGATEDLAKTLSGRLSNLKESFADFGASLIGLVATPLKQGVTLIQSVLQELANFIKGEVSPAFLVLRTAIGGAAVAIGLLLGAKAAAEALRILATSAQLLLTPFGALVAIFAGLGAAFAVMRTRSEEFRQVTDRLGRLLGTQLGNVWRAIGDAVETVRAAFTEVRAPVTQTADALERAAGPARTWISEIGTRLGTAIGIAGRFLTDTLIPALAQVAIFIGQRIGPAFRFLREQLTNFATFVAPFVEAGFKRIGQGFDFMVERAREVVRSIRNVASGASSALGPGLAIGGALLGGTAIAGPVGGIVAAIAAAFATLSPRIRESIVTGVTAARNRVVEIFNGIDWNELGKKALRFTNRVGFILGNIITDRRFVAALAGIAAAAALVAVNFVTGFAEGVLDNVGPLLDLGRDIAGKIVEGIIDFLSSPQNAALALALGAAFLAGNGIRKIGQKVALEFDNGLKTGFANTTRKGGTLLGGLFGGPGAVEADARRVALRTQTALNTEFRRINQTIRAAGGIGTAAGSFVTQADVNDARKRLKQIEGVLGTTGLAAIRLRGAFSDMFRGLSVGVGTRSISGIFSSLKTGAGDISAALKGQGAAIGSALGVAVLGGFAAAVSGAQAGSGNTGAGFTGILVSAIGAGLATGSPLVGAAVGGIGLIAAAITSFQAKAKNTAAAVTRIREALEGLSSLAGRQAASAIQGTISDEFQKEAQATRQAFIDIGLTAENAATEFVRLGSSGSEAVAKLRGPFDDLIQTADKATFSARFDEAREAIGRVAATSPFLAERLRLLFEGFENGTISQKAFKEALDEIFDTAGETGTALKEAGLDAQVFGEDIDGATQAVNAFNVAAAVHSVLQTAIRAAETAANDAKTALENAKTAADNFLNPTQGTLQSAVAGVITNLGSIGTSLGEANALGGFVGGAQATLALENLRGQIADVVKTGIDTGASEADIDANLGIIQASIAELPIDDATKAQMVAEVQAAIDQTGITVPVAADIPAAAKAGRDMSGAVARELKGGASTARGLGTNIGSAFASGISATAAAVARAARAAALAAKDAIEDTLGIKSPSTVFIGIGENVGNAFASGIQSTAQAVASAGSGLATTAFQATAEQIQQQKDELKQLQADFFGETFAGESSLDAIKRSINDDLSSILSRAQQLDVDTLERLKAGGELGNPRSLELNLEGIENRGLIASAVDNIKNLGETLLAQGAPIQEVINNMLATRQNLIDFATNFGFNRAELEALIATLGLSTEAISKFNDQVGKITPPPIEDPNATTGGTAEPIVNVTIENLVTPFPDPQVTALAVANGTVMAMRRR